MYLGSYLDRRLAWKRNIQMNNKTKTGFKKSVLVDRNKCYANDSKRLIYTGMVQLRGFAKQIKIYNINFANKIFRLITIGM